MFKGKVDGRLVGTVGVFISMSGYSEDTIEALTLGKSLNVILFGRSDIEACLSGQPTFTEAMRRKLRAAGDEALVYFEIVTKEVVSERTPDAVSISVSEQATSLAEVREELTPFIAVVCEGRTDELVLSAFTARILRESGLEARVRFIVAMGKTPLARLANMLRATLPSEAKLVLVVDSDGDISGTEQLIQRDLAVDADLLVMADPSIEVWFYPDGQYPRAEAIREFGRLFSARLAERVNDIDMVELRERVPSFAEFYEKMTAWAKAKV